MKHKFLKEIILLCIVALINILPIRVNAYTKIFYYTDTISGRESLYKNWKLVDIFAPQAYTFDENGVLHGFLNPEVVTFTQTHKIKVLPLVTNGNFSHTSLFPLLNDKSIQDKAIAQLVAEAQIQKYIGWQIDFEQIPVEYKDKFSDFIKNFANEMHKNNLVASVAVVSKISDNPDDYKNQLWADLIGSYDYKSLGESCDFVSIMSYDDPDSNGPIARNAWLKKVVVYSKKMIPKEKISLGIALYYWQWNTTTGKLVGIGGYEKMKVLIKNNKTSFGYSKTEKEEFMKFRYKKNNYIVWYENELAVREKIAFIKKEGLHGFSAWKIGLEAPSIYKALK